MYVCTLVNTYEHMDVIVRILSCVKYTRNGYTVNSWKKRKCTERARPKLRKQEAIFQITKIVIFQYIIIGLIFWVVLYGTRVTQVKETGGEYLNHYNRNVQIYYMVDIVGCFPPGVLLLVSLTQGF
eukprot:TRINITY_DN1555_c1_g1_i4.p12 TRINITY_DN1555_c1_g1~~TRINITY_DN1555_c1_g1_i4.p12  ORF type:complete len:126 (+),score=0.50 TRINITY_DN1555_c1_g1_i4:677-1054(+)